MAQCDTFAISFCFLFKRSGDHRDIHVLKHSFPTRRSSDLLQLKIPIYEGGRVNAQTRQAREKYGDSLEQIAFAEREVVAETRSAFANWRSAQRGINAARSRLPANEHAPPGIRPKHKKRFRPLLHMTHDTPAIPNPQVTPGHS